MSSISFCFALIFALVLVSTEARWWGKNPLLRETNVTVLRQIRALRQRVRDTGCDINLCFALQGDDFITDKQFQDQINFVDLMIAILTTDKKGNYCAVQYGSTTKPISPLTFRKRKFFRKLRKAKRVGGLDTNVAGALGYTGFQLLPRDDDANKVIILGDGLESVGFRPKRIAKRILKGGIDISAVAVDSASYDALKDIVGGDSNNCLLYTSPSPRDLSTSRMPSSA